MSRILLYLKDNILKGRKAMPHELPQQVFNWKGIDFEVTQSPLMMINWPILLPELEPSEAQALLDLVGARYPFSPRYEELKHLSPELAFSGHSDEWVFFGGSFNPWHKGHQACLALLPEDKLCFILPDRNPLKELTPLEPVSKTIELVTKIKFGKNHFIAPTFLLDFQKNPTISWVEKLKTQFPDQRLSLLMGFDSFLNLFKWQRPEDLMKRLDTLYVVSRLEDQEEQQHALSPVKAAAPGLKVIFLGRHEFEGLSSTELRKKSV